jgi:hypothetical protein
MSGVDGELDLVEKDPGRLSVESGCARWALQRQGPWKRHRQHFFALDKVMSPALCDLHDETGIPVTFCNEFVRRLPLERQGTYTELQ